MEKEELSKIRANVIDLFINTETLINIIITQHYFEKTYIPFVLEVLYDEYCSMGFKQSVLRKILPDADDMHKKLRRLVTIRNHFLHRGMVLTRGLDKSGPTFVPDPQNVDRDIDFRVLFTEFQKLEPEITGWLFKEAERLGVKPEKE